MKGEQATTMGELLAMGRELPDVKGHNETWEPNFDVKLSSSGLEIFVDLPGVDEDEISVETRNGDLFIVGRRDFDHDNEDAEEFTRLCRPYGSFSVSVTVPEGMDANQARAKYKRGVLRVQVPRKTRS